MHGVEFTAWCLDMYHACMFQIVQKKLLINSEKASQKKYVEVGRVCGLNCHKPKSSSIRKPNSPRNIIPSIADV